MDKSYEKGEQLYEQAEKAFNSANTSNLELKTEPFRQALSLFDQCMETKYGEGNMLVKWYRALCLFYLERNFEAEKEFEKFLRFEITDLRSINQEYDCVMHLGMSLTRLGYYREAEAAFEELINRCPIYECDNRVKKHLELCKHDGNI